MSTSSQFQALDYLEHTQNLSKKDWILKLIKLFPNGGIVNNLSVVELEHINTLETSDQKEYISTMINKMEIAKKQVPVHHHDSQSNLNSGVDLKNVDETNSKPLTILF